VPNGLPKIWQRAKGWAREIAGTVVMALEKQLKTVICARSGRVAVWQGRCIKSGYEAQL